MLNNNEMGSSPVAHQFNVQMWATMKKFLVIWENISYRSFTKIGREKKSDPSFVRSDYCGWIINKPQCLGRIFFILIILILDYIVKTSVHMYYIPVEDIWNETYQNVNNTFFVW